MGLILIYKQIKHNKPKFVICCYQIKVTIKCLDFQTAKCIRKSVCFWSGSERWGINWSSGLCVLDTPKAFDTVAKWF